MVSAAAVAVGPVALAVLLWSSRVLAACAHAGRVAANYHLTHAFHVVRGDGQKPRRRMKSSVTSYASLSPLCGRWYA